MPAAANSAVRRSTASRRVGLEDLAQHLPDALSGGQRECATAVVVATHDERISTHCDRVLHLVDGELQ